MKQHEQTIHYPILFIILTGVFLSTLDSSMVNIALPSIMRDFQVPMNEVKQIVIIYLMVVTVSLVFWGRFADKIGRTKVYLLGMGIFVIFGASSSLSVNLTMMSCSRCFQAMGAAMMMSSGPALLKIKTPPENLGRTLGLVGIATACGLMAGPVLGGYILAHWGWRYLFLVPLPLGLVVCCSNFLSFSHYSKESLKQREHGATFDWLGSVIWTLIVCGYGYCLAFQEIMYGSKAVIAILVLVLLVYFVRVEKETSTPILPVQLVKNKFYWTGVVCNALSFCALFIVIILMPFFLDYVMGYPVDRIGLAMMALPVTLVAVSPFAGWLYDQLKSAKIISSFGLAICGLAVLSFLKLSPTFSFFSIFWRLALVGAGQSLFLAPNNASVLSQIDEQYSGITSGVMATARNFGMLTGTGIAGGGFAYFFTRYSNGVSLHNFQSDYIEPFILAQHNILLVAFFILSVGFIVSLLRD